MCRESIRSLPMSSNITIHSPLRRSLQLDVSNLRPSKIDSDIDYTNRPPSQSTIIDRVTTVAHRNYRTIAYGVVIICYVIGLMEYLYLRLTVAVSSSNGAVQMSRDDKGKDAFHYICAVMSFFAIALFQLICFFGLTLSERFISIVKKRESNHQVPSHLSLIINRTIQKTFVCYGMCSAIVCMLIFYMLGIEDSLDIIASTVCTYLLDVFVILYFISFPLITIIYHPHIYCTKDIQPTSSIPPPSSQQYTSLSPPSSSYISPSIPINQFDTIPPLDLSSSLSNSSQSIQTPQRQRIITTV